ncbi:MAG: hypothetical protein GXO82_06560 [Chlorobi bacterium]|nr:hypothetical protein [Chlorobiota bacterium]
MKLVVCNRDVEPRPTLVATDRVAAADGRDKMFFRIKRIGNFRRSAAAINRQRRLNNRFPGSFEHTIEFEQEQMASHHAAIL